MIDLIISNFFVVFTFASRSVPSNILLLVQTIHISHKYDIWTKPYSDLLFQQSKFPESGWLVVFQVHLWHTLYLKPTDVAEIKADACVKKTEQ